MNVPGACDVDAGGQCCGGASCGRPQAYSYDGGTGTVCCGGFGASCTKDYDCCNGYACGDNSHTCDQDSTPEHVDGTANDSWASDLQVPAEMDLLWVRWAVPNIPHVTTDINSEAIWPGLYSSSRAVLNQPVLRYDYPDTNWTIHPESIGPNWDDVVKPYDAVNVGDQITGYVQLVSGGWCTNHTYCPPADGTESWLIHIDNTAGGGDQVQELTEVLTGFGPFPIATLMELELHGLHACAGLPVDNELEIFEWEVDQAGNDHGGGGPEAYIPSTQSPLWATVTNSEAPNCRWGANADAGPPNTGAWTPILTWAY